jgi:hypothetical protein
MNPPAPLGAKPDPGLMSRIEFRLATAADDPDLRQLLRENPLQGEICVSLEREPDVFLAGSVEGEQHHTIVARDGAEGPVVGMASRSVYGSFLNGEPCRIGYLSQLRLNRGYRGRAGLLSRGYALMRSLRTPADLPFDITTIIGDNVAARRILTAGLADLPVYRELEALTTLILPVWRRVTTSAPLGIRIERGSLERIEEIAGCLERNRSRYQFAPRWSVGDLLSPERSRGLAPRDFFVAFRGATVVGCLALWDQSSFKQIVVRGYGARMRRWRPWVDGAARLLGAPRLPEPGRPISHSYISHLAVDDDRPDVFASLFAGAYNEARAQRRDCLVVGLAARHPFLTELKRRYRPWIYSSIIYVVDWDRATDTTAALDGRIPHLEVALL